MITFVKLIKQINSNRLRIKIKSLISNFENELYSN